LGNLPKIHLGEGSFLTLQLLWGSPGEMMGKKRGSDEKGENQGGGGGFLCERAKSRWKKVASRRE